MNTLSKQKGITLVEVMLIIAVVGIIGMPPPQYIIYALIVIAITAFTFAAAFLLRYGAMAISRTPREREKDNET